MAISHKVKRAELIFSLDYIAVPLGFDVVEQIFKTVSQNRIAFHVMNIKYLDQLVKNQSTTTSISCSRNRIIQPDSWAGPDLEMAMNDPRLRDPKKNIIVKVKGFINYGSNMDLWTAPDEHGNRWITDKIGGDPIVASGMQKIIDALQKYKEEKYSDIEVDYNDVPVMPKPKRDVLEKEYIEEAKKLFTKHKDSLISNMKKVLSKQTVRYANTDTEEYYDEFVVSNYKIISVAIPTSSTNIKKQTIAQTIEKKHKLKVVDCGSQFFNLSGDGL